MLKQTLSHSLPFFAAKSAYKWLLIDVFAYYAGIRKNIEYFNSKPIAPIYTNYLRSEQGVALKCALVQCYENRF